MLPDYLKHAALERDEFANVCRQCSTYCICLDLSLVLDVGAQCRYERGRRLLYCVSYSEPLYTQPD
jgi:hypothetical protein